MSTIIDLNTATTVTFNNESDYAIVFGTNAGNTTANVDSYASATITKQTPLDSITDAVRDLLIDVQFSNVGVVNMAYTGAYSNIGLLQIAPAAWRVNGIRTLAQYDEAFANVRYIDLQGAQVTSPEYSYITTVNDQSGNTRTWNTTVNVLVQPTLTVSGNLVYNEDTLTPMTQVSVAVDPDSSTMFRLFANTIPAYGTMTDGVVTGNSVFIDGSSATLNTQLSSGVIKFLPASDFVSNVANAINIKLTSGPATVNTANVNIQLGSEDIDYTLTTNYNYTEDAGIRMDYAVTDADTHALGYTVTFNQTSGTTGQFVVNNVLQGIGNAAVISGTKANVSVANVTFLTYPDTTGNVGLTYSQVKSLNTGNVIQASNVAITANCTSTHDEYTFATSGTYPEDDFLVFGNVGNLISDTDPRATSYNISLSQSTGNVGKWYVNNTVYGNSNVTLNLSNTRANINSANIKFLPAIDSTANLTFVYNQVKVNNAFGNITQASNVAGVYTCVTNNEIANMINRSYTSNTVNNIFSSSTPVLDDGPDLGQTYTITLSSALGKFGNSAPNAVAASSYSFTGNTTQVNSEFTNMVFVPNTGPASTGAFTYTQSRDGVSQVNVNPTLTGSTGALPSATYTFTSNTTWTPSFDEYYYGNAQVLMVGGGGAGGKPVNRPMGSGGGGSNDYSPFQWTRLVSSLEYRSYTMQIGDGGSQDPSVGGNGKSSRIRRTSDSSQVFISSFGISGGQNSGGNCGIFDNGGIAFDTNPPSHGGGGGGAYQPTSRLGNAAWGEPGTSSGPGDGGAGFTWTLGGVTVGAGGGGCGTTSGGTKLYGINGISSYGGGGRAGFPTEGVNEQPQPGQPGVIIIKFV
jgi:hypothetical protein